MRLAQRSTTRMCGSCSLGTASRQVRARARAKVRRVQVRRAKVRVKVRVKVEAKAGTLMHLQPKSSGSASPYHSTTATLPRPRLRRHRPRKVLYRRDSCSSGLSNDHRGPSGQRRSACRAARAADFRRRVFCVRREPLCVVAAEHARGRDSCEHAWVLLRVLIALRAGKG